MYIRATDGEVRKNPSIFNAACSFICGVQPAQACGEPAGKGKRWKSAVGENKENSGIAKREREERTHLGNVC